MVEESIQRVSGCSVLKISVHFFKILLLINNKKYTYFRRPSSAVKTDFTCGLLGNMVMIFFEAAAISAGCAAT